MNARHIAILADLRAGLTHTEIAARHSCAQSLVSKVALRNGLRRYREREVGRYGYEYACPETAALSGGRWMPRGGIQVWVSDERESA